MEDRLPRFNLADIERRRDVIAQEVLGGLHGRVIDGEVVNALVDDLQRRLLTGTPRDAIFESIRHLAGRPIDPAIAMQTAWRLAGNMSSLRAGTAVPPWSGQAQKEWVPLLILRVTPGRNQKGEIGYTFIFRALAGSCCPMLLRSFWASGMIRFVAGHIGFSFKRASRYPFHKAPELVGLRFLGEIDPARSRFEPSFWGVEFPPSFIQWNRDAVLDQRMRIKPCPRNFMEPCRNCVVGYNECVGGTHKLNYEQRFCDYCGENAWFDPELGNERCIKCCHKHLTQKR